MGSKFAGKVPVSSSTETVERMVSSFDRLSASVPSFPHPDPPPWLVLLQSSGPNRTVVSEFPCFWWADRRDFWRANRPVLCFSPQRLMEMKTINIINIHMHSYFTTTNLKWIFPTPEWNWGPCRTRSNGRCSHKGRTTWPVEIWRAMTCLIMHLESSHATNNVQTSYNVQRLPGRMLPQRESSTPRKWQIAPCAKSDVQHSWGSALE